MPLPRLVLIEDDLHVRRFVEMALHGLPVEVVGCASVAAGVEALRQAPAGLVITDLMLPDGPAHAMVDQLAADAALRGNARIVVLSGAISAPVRLRLERLGVWRVLEKPVSLAALEACVSEALGIDLDAQGERALD